MTRANGPSFGELESPPPGERRARSEVVPRSQGSAAFGELELELEPDTAPALFVGLVDDDEPTSRGRPAHALPPPSATVEEPTRMHLEEGAAARDAALAAIRELYAGGETAAALALASEVAVSLLAPSRVPRLLVAPAEILQLALDARAGFLLAHVDGTQSMEEILDVCAMPEAEALAILDRLRALGVIAW